jgi:hypothetical protein
VRSKKLEATHSACTFSSASTICADTLAQGADFGKLVALVGDMGKLVKVRSHLRNRNRKLADGVGIAGVRIRFPFSCPVCLNDVSDVMR